MGTGFKNIFGDRNWLACIKKKKLFGRCGKQFFVTDGINFGIRETQHKEKVLEKDFFLKLESVRGNFLSGRRKSFIEENGNY